MISFIAGYYTRASRTSTDGGFRPSIVTPGAWKWGVLDGGVVEDGVESGGFLNHHFREWGLSATPDLTD